MAEYYPLLARAVSAQSNAPKETRQGIYERARKALLGQLRAHDPPLSEEDIQREAKALEDAIARVEDELQPPPAAAASRPSAASFNSPPKAMTLAERARAHRENLASNAAKKKPEARTESAARVAAAPVPASSVAAAPVGGAAAAPVLRAPESSDLRADKNAAPSAFAPMVHTMSPADAPEASAPLVFGETKPISFPAEQKTVPAGGLLWKLGRSRTDAENLGERGAPSDGVDAPSGTGVPPTAAGSPVSLGDARPEPSRPLAPLVGAEKRRSSLRWVLGALATVIVASVAVLAFMLRDVPQKAPPRASVATAPPDKVQSKIIDRIGIGPTRMDAAGSAAGSLDSHAQASSAPLQPSSSAPAPATAPASPPRAAPTGAPAVAAGAPTVASAPTSASADAAVPVAQRAALLVQSPTSSDPQAIATFVGTVIWRLETVSRGSGQPPELAVRALVDIPDAHFKASMLLEKNEDASLPASHTMELRFTTDPAIAVAEVKQIDTPQMRKEDSPAGDPLSGIPTPITSNYFLVGLTKGDPEQSHNIDLIQGAGWFDVPMLLANGKIAKVTFEKGIAGQKALSDALASWGN